MVKSSYTSMTARGLALCLFGLTMVAVHGHARAQEETAPSSRETATRIDPAFAFMATVMESFGPKATVFGVGAGTTSTVNPAGAGALLRFTRVLELHELIELQAAGVRFPGETSKTVPRMGTIYRAWLPWHALEVLETHPLLVRAEATWKPRPLPPLEVTSAIVGAAEIRRLPNLDLDGKGVVIGSIDSGIDVFHPAFFHADGEHYDWIDVNGNGRFEPGVDAVDLNRNGQADRNETLRVLDATVVTSFDGPEIENADGILQVNRDWLYADMNHDGRRNAGRQAGFFEDDPAYGEPIFVVDDVNGNGQLDVGEKLIRLKTSKIRKYYEGDRVFERGVDLIEAVESEHFRGAYHGTGVAGILVGGQPGHHDRVGLAPGAELIVYGYGLYMDWEATIHTHYLERAVDDGVDILLHEWTNPVMRPLDGSTNLEAAMDHLYSEEDIIQINPVGNLNTSDKHTMVTGSPGEELRLGFVVEDGFSVGADLRPITTVYASLQWRGDHLPRLFVATPMDDRIELFLDDPELVEVPGGYVRMLYERTSRGTHMATFYLFTAAEDLSLPAGVWNLIVDQIEEEEIFFGRIGDQHTIWRGGVVWRQGSRDVSTLSFPATADSAFGVSAFGGRRALEVSDALPPGSLRAYAGRGPRLDGSPSVNLAAPDDPYVPLAATSLIREAGGDYGWFAPFGGTSGAAPHVAASLALLKERHPSWTAAELLGRLEETASREGLVPLVAEFPDPQWGWGKIDLPRALGIERHGESEPPRAELRVEVLNEELLFDASRSYAPNTTELEYRFDYVYDGNWDGEWGDQARMRVPRTLFDEGRVYVGRVQVRDARGMSSGALFVFQLTEEHIGDDVGWAGDVDQEVGPTEAPSGDPHGGRCLCSIAPRPLSSPPVFGMLVGCVLWRRRRRGQARGTGVECSTPMGLFSGRVARKPES